MPVKRLVTILYIIFYFINSILLIQHLLTIVKLFKIQVQSIQYFILIL